LSPDKRVPQLLTAFAATLTAVPSARLLLAGAPADHLDLKAEIKKRGIGSRTIVTGYVDSDERLTENIAACDASFNLRWPTAGELSGPWLRCLALGLPTVIVDLAHLAHVPSLDPRTWQSHGGIPGKPICIAVDILDEEHSLVLAMRRLAGHADLRERLGRAAAEYWRQEHSPERMAEDYRGLMARSIDSEIPSPAWLHEFQDDGGAVLDGVTEAFGLPAILR
jgi:glycosyltransferase involved in cell wall biosynthesis